MRNRAGEVWEAKSHMNGERVVVILSSQEARSLYQECTLHRCLHVTGNRAGRIIDWTEQGDWDKSKDMKRLA